MLNLYERQIVCVCESCWALRSGDAEFRPTGTRTLWLEDFELPEELWAQFRIPIGLAFFMHSSVTDCVVAMYPSPAGATESELHFETWSRLVEMNPVLATLEPDAEALIVNRMSDPPAFAIAPIDRCYMLVGLVKVVLGGDLGRRWRRGGDRVLLRRAPEGGRVSRPEVVEVPVAPEPEFEVLGATGRRHAAVPALDFDVHVTEPGGRQVYAIALTAQVMIEPARRELRRRDAREARRAVRAAGALGHDDPQPRLAPGGRARARRSPVRRPSGWPCRRSFDMEVASSKYLYGLPDGEVPLAFNFNGTVHYRADDGRLQISLVPWSCSAEFRLPVSHVARPDRPLLPAHRVDRAARVHDGRASAREGAARAADTRRLRGGAAR